jgi:hypothetical protein
MKLMSEALRVLSDGGCLAVVLLLRLLVTWLTDCPPAVASLLAHASHLPLLVDLAAGRLGGGDACTSGQGRGGKLAWSPLPAHNVKGPRRRHWIMTLCTPNQP